MVIFILQNTEREKLIKKKNKKLLFDLSELRDYLLTLIYLYFKSHLYEYLNNKH